MFRTLAAAACGVLVTLVAGHAWAAPITWTVPSTTLPDGATVSGTFVYDTATSTISNVNITQTNVRPGTYTFAADFPAPYRGGQRAAAVAVGDETWWIRTDAIPAAGGAYTVPSMGTGTCISVFGGVCTNANVGNSVANVTITSAAAASIPTLSEWAMILFGVILAGAAALYLQRKRLSV